MYERRIILGFIRVHIMYHASLNNGIYGLEMIKELERHGYKISPGTLYPILHEMKNDGVLKLKKIVVNGKVRKIYKLTPKGSKILDKLKCFITELSQEVI
jgi:DNA-binding PadR family transcriptional regulator